MKQRTEEWVQARLGKVTASRIADVMATTRSGYGASRRNYMAELLAERLSGQQAESYVSSAMQWGTDHEGEARATYEFDLDVIVEDVGFVPHPTIEMSGASPDGLVGEDGLIEIKCPNTATHIQTLLNPKVDRKYNLQIQWQLVCTGRAWCDFLSYDPRLFGHETCIIHVVRDDSLIEQIIHEVKLFLLELSQMQEQIEAL